MEWHGVDRDGDGAGGLNQYRVAVTRSDGTDVELKIQAATEEDAKAITYVGMIHTFDDHAIEIQSITFVGAVVTH